MAGEPGGRPDSSSLAQEAVAIAGVAVALFLLFALASFSGPAADGTLPAGRNWCGAVGQFVAALLASLLGISAFWLPLLVLMASLPFFSGRASLEPLPRLWAGGTGVLLASSGLAALIGPAQGIELFRRRFPTGGQLGAMVATFLATYFGVVGAFLLLAALLVLTIMLATRQSPVLWSRRLVVRGRELAAARQAGRAAATAVIAPAPPAAARPLPPPAADKPARTAAPVVHLPKPQATAGKDEEDFQPTALAKGGYQLPSLSLLDKLDAATSAVDTEVYLAVSQALEAKLQDFGVEGQVVGISPGPVVTTYEYAPAPGVKINRIVALADDLALGLKSESVRIVGSVPGKAALGIEIPNPVRQTVPLRDILATELFQGARSRLTLALGMDVIGNPRVFDLARMPHLLIAGATGSGKSVAINTIICSILFRATPEEVRMLMVDPKRIELSAYDAIPHLLHPVVVDPKMANRALRWAVQEMERRYQQMEERRVKGFEAYNKVAEVKLPYVVIIIDELADLMLVASRDVEESICRLAQMARAAGMHLILATQRPSVDVLTGLIKANFPTRISFKVSSKFDSRTVLDTSGAEHLLGAGDMLFLAPGTAKLQRVHGAYVSEPEIERLVTFLKGQGQAVYDETVLQLAEEEDEAEGGGGEGDYDEKYDEAVAAVCEMGQASISSLQRRLRVGYNRAARMIERMEKDGVVGPADGVKPREVLVRREYS
ncbi:MAG: DNA translocase FtsK [Thermodesulfobacteriota bacterium]